MPDDAFFDAPHEAFAGVDGRASFRHSPALTNTALAEALYTMVYQADIWDYGRYRFDSNGTPRKRTRAFSATAALLIKEQVGSGKSRRAHIEIKAALDADPELRIAFVVSHAKLQSQAKGDLESATGRTWMSYVGFEREVDGVSICRFPEQAKAAHKVGQDPYQLCGGCPHQGGCAIWAQYTSRASFWVVTHAQLRHGLKPFDGRAAFDVVIIDEDPTSTLQAEERHRASCLLDGSKQGTKPHAACAEVYREITVALIGDGSLRALALPRPKDLLRAAESLSKTKVTITRDRAPDEAAVAGAEKGLQAAALLRDLVDAMAMGWGTDGQLAGCMAHVDQHGAIVVDIAVPRDIHPQFADASDVQVLSATAKPLLLQRSIPHLEVDEAEWQPYEHGKFVYLQSAKTSVTSLLGKGRLGKGGQQAHEVIGTLSRRHDRLLVVAQKYVEAALLKAGLPDNVATEHFNALEGLNDYAQYDAVIILGRPLPEDADLIIRAEAAAGGFIDVPLSWTNNETGKTGPTFGERVRLERTAKDGTTYTIGDYLHADPHLDAVRRVTTYGAVAQADRSRGQHRGPENPVAIYDATGLDNVWQIDEVEHWRSLCGWYGEMEGFGFVLHPAASKGVNQLLSTLLPHRFPTYPSARDHRKRAKDEHDITLEKLVADCPFKDGVVVDIKLPGVRCGVPVIVNAETAREAAEIIRRHPNIPEGTKISRKARHTMRLVQPPGEETQDDDVIYELAARPRELAAAAETAGAEDTARECEEELVCEDGAAPPPCTNA